MRSGVTVDAAPTATRKRSRAGAAGPRPYDFRRPDKLGRDQGRLLQIAGETFARQFGMVLTSTLRAMSTVTMLSVEQLTYDEYARSLENPTCLTVIALDGISGIGAIELPLATAMLAVDYLLGGTGQGTQPRRAPTEIESAVLRHLIERLLHELDYAFEALTPLSPRVTAIEANPRFAQVAASSAMMVVKSFEVKIGTHESVATLCLPYSALGPILEEAVQATAQGGRNLAADGAFRSGLRDRLAEVEVDVSVRFAAARMPTRDVIGLQVGDVVRLPHRTADPLLVTSSGVVAARAVPGSKGRRLACRIVAPATQPSPDPRRS